MNLLAMGLLIAQSFFGGSPIDGIRCDSMEGAVEHIHAHLLLVDRGRALQVPAAVGIPNGSGCLYWVHTHTADGFIHIEAPVKRSFTLGQFFDIWGMDLSAAKAASMHAPRGHKLSIWVNGAPYAGDPNRIALKNHETIVIQNGPPFVRPVKVDWGSL
ncbi:MAG TPA: hypothetical protein VIG46_03520 [Candidatus Baltobacteraceae bacterium]